MKYTVDGALCSGPARCQTVAPGVFDPDESMVPPTVPEILRQPARTPRRR
jgi:ferredoxin